MSEATTVPAEAATDDPWLTTDEVAKQLGVKKHTVWKWIREHKLTGYRFGTSRDSKGRKHGYLRVRQSDLDTFIDDARTTAH